MGAIAGVLAWIGWLTLCPALGFPTLATAAMLNRVLAPREDPGFGLGWVLSLIGLALAALLYLWLVDRGRLRPSVASGLGYGAVCWLLAGVVLMPLLGLAGAPAAPGTPAGPGPPDPMQGSFMMLHLGAAAPIAALVAWLAFGAVLGGTSAAAAPWTRADSRRLGGALLGLGLLVGGVAVARLAAGPASPAQTTVTLLASGPVETLPQGATFFSVIELPQAVGATLGPHAHVAGFAYSISGVETIAFAGGRTIRVGPRQAGFMGAQEGHAHLNIEDRVLAAGAALSIVALAAASGLIGSRATRHRTLAPVTLVLLIGLGAIGAWNPWSNDWLFLAVRPAAARGAPMPLPSAARTYESPDIANIPPGPYVETLEEVTVPPGGVAAEVGSEWPAAVLVLEGRAELQQADGQVAVVNARGGALLEAGEQVTLGNDGQSPVRALRFAVVPSSAMPPSLSPG